MGTHIKNNILPVILCAFITSSLVISIAQGFYIPAVYANNVIIIFTAAVALTFVWMLFAYKRQTIIFGIILTVFVIASTGLWLRAKGIDIIDSEESKSEIYIFAIILFFTALVVFLLSHTQTGSAIMFFLGNIVMAILAFLEFDSHLLALITFQIACAILFIFLVYKKGLFSAAVANPHFLRTGTIAAGAALLACLLACGSFFAIIRPLQLPVHDLTLLTRFVSMKIVDIIGIEDMYNIPDINNQSSSQEHTEDQVTSNQEEADENEINNENTSQLENEGEQAANRGNGDDIEALAVSYTKHKYLLLALFAIIVAAIISAVLLKRWRRRCWHENLKKRTEEKQVELLYMFFLKHWEMLNYERLNGETLYEYSVRMKDRLRGFELHDEKTNIANVPAKEDTIVNVEWLTDVFIRTHYGGEKVMPEELSKYQQYYAIFYNKLRNALGNIRYAIKYMFL